VTRSMPATVFVIAFFQMSGRLYGSIIAATLKIKRVRTYAFDLLTVVDASSIRRKRSNGYG
jgi:hypothetical protein